MGTTNSMRDFILKIGDAIELAWFVLVGLFFMLWVFVVPMFQKYAIMCVHELDKRAFAAARRDGKIR
jgi:hypothetical protein